MITNHSSVSVVPFHWAHVRMMDLRPFEQMYFKQFPDYDARLKAMSQYEHSYTALLRGEIACCWGRNAYMGGRCRGLAVDFI